MLDWSKLKPYKTAKTKSFEQLCYQIAIRLYGQMGNFTPVDDSGGGDGVEFFLTLLNGEEWGWQAKYYENSPRLRDSNRKEAIIDSLRRALEVHPNLTKWYLCIPMDFNKAEDNWFKKELPKNIPTGRNVEIIPWSHSFFHEKVYQPQFNGIWQSFFNLLELDNDWFQKTFNNSYSLVKNKFEENLYIPNGEFEYWYLNPLLCNSGFKDRIKEYLDVLTHTYEQSIIELDEMKITNKAFQTAFSTYRGRIARFNEIFTKNQAAIYNRLERLNANDITKFHRSDFSEIINEMSHILGMADQEAQKLIRNQITEEEDMEGDNQIQYNSLVAHESSCKKIIENLNNYIRDTCIPLKTQIAHYYGGGGAGKTNLCIGIAKDYLSKKHPVLFFSAIKLNTDQPLSEQLLGQLDIRAGHNFGDLLDTLNEIGKICNVRVPFIIDGLNEAIIQNGQLNPILKRDMPVLENEISLRDHLVLITTCRPSYQSIIWPDFKINGDSRFHPLYGFINEKDKKKLVQKYFDVYKIEADYSFVSFQQFGRPLYLKIYCETINPERKEIKQVTLGYDSIYTIFEKFIDRCDRQIFERLTEYGWAPIGKNRKLASNILNKIAQMLWDTPSRHFELENLIEVADPTGFSNYYQSATKALLDEELLFTRDSYQESDHIYITYDAMTGYVIAKHLIETVVDIKEFLNGPDMDKLSNNKYIIEHPQNEDILTALCTLLPIKKQLFVHDLIWEEQSTSKNNEKLLQESIAATLTLSPQYIPEDQINYIRMLLTEEANLIPILTKCEPVLFAVNHPFNFSLFDHLLWKMPMNRRDVVWTEHIRASEDGFVGGLIAEFKRLQNLNVHTTEQKAKIELVGTYLIWNLTTTNKTLKQQVSDALYTYGFKNPTGFLNFYFRFASVNDPTIFEWLSMICYNLQLALTQSSIDILDDGFNKLAAFIRDSLFNKDSNITTNHIIIRDYAYRTLELLSFKIPAIAKTTELKIIKKTFLELGVTQWETETDKNEKEYRSGNSLIHHRFGKEKMFAISSTGDEYRPTDIYLERLGNLRWRAYGLGYDFALFGELDKEIAGLSAYGDLFPDIKRYADKYIDIAYQELCGYLDDRMLLRNFRETGNLRMEKPQFEPSQVVDTMTKTTPSRFITSDYIDVNSDIISWCNNRSVIDPTEHLQISDFLGRKGDWSLLHGFFHQCKPSYTRQFFKYMEAIMIPEKDYSLTFRILSEATNIGVSSDPPFSDGVQGGEIPDGRAIPFNKMETWHCTLVERKVKVKYEKHELFINDIILTGSKRESAFLELQRKTGKQGFDAEMPKGIPPPLSPLFFQNGRPVMTVIKALESMKAELKPVTYERQEIRQRSKDIRIMHPVRVLKHKFYASKNIIDHFKLTRTAQSTDLYDSSGSLASFSHKLKNSYVDQEIFCYIKKDLLKQFLTDNSLKMVYVIWGVRDYYPEDGDWQKAIRSGKALDKAKFKTVLPFVE